MREDAQVDACRHVLDVGMRRADDRHVGGVGWQRRPVERAIADGVPVGGYRQEAGGLGGWPHGDGQWRLVGDDGIGIE